MRNQSMKIENKLTQEQIQRLSQFQLQSLQILAMPAEALQEALQKEYPDSAFSQLSMNNVNATMGKEFFGKCLVAVALAFVLISMWIPPFFLVVFYSIFSNFILINLLFYFLIA